MLVNNVASDDRHTLESVTPEYWDNRMLRERGQNVDVANGLMKWLGIVPSMSGFDTERLGAGLKNPPDPLGENAWDRLSSSSYGTVYFRTATAMHDLEERLGTPVMERAMKEYYRRWRFRHPSSADLRAAQVTVRAVSVPPTVGSLAVFENWICCSAAS